MANSFVTILCSCKKALSGSHKYHYYDTFLKIVSSNARNATERMCKPDVATCHHFLKPSYHIQFSYNPVFIYIFCGPLRFPRAVIPNRGAVSRCKGCRQILNNESFKY